MRIGIISDTHNVLRPEVIESMKTCSYILHAGDVCNEEILNQLRSIANVYVVRGNNDIGQWAEHYKEIEAFTIDGVKFLMKHVYYGMPKEAEKADVLVVGHSHQYRCDKLGEQWLLNPGSCGRRRFNYPLTWMILETNQGKIEIIKHELKLESQ